MPASFIAFRGRGPGALLVLIAGCLGCSQQLARATPAQEAIAPPAAPVQRSAAELERLAKPIALHPDPLIAMLLPAAVYPLEIVQAARFVHDTNNIPKVDQQSWDENVKAVAKFPALIAQMDADLDWTVQLGAAFLEQPKELMDAIQALRLRAQQAGTLRSTPQQVVTVTNMLVIQTNVTQVVTVTNQIVQVQPSDPQVVYVPTYPPTVYYPPPGYVYDPYAPLVTFGVGIAVGAIIANNCDWHGGGIWIGGGGMVVWGGGYHGDVDVDIDIDRTVNRGDRPTPQSTARTANTASAGQKWQPDANRLRSAGATATTSSRETRGWGDAATRPSGRPAPSPSARPTTTPPISSASRPGPGTQPSRSPAAANPSVSTRPSTATASAPSASVPRPAPAAQAPSANRAASVSPATAQRPQAPNSNRSTPQSYSAFSGVNSNPRPASNRGAVSRGGGGRRR